MCVQEDDFPLTHGAINTPDWKTKPCSYDIFAYFYLIET